MASHYFQNKTKKDNVCVTVCLAIKTTDPYPMDLLFLLASFLAIVVFGMVLARIVRYSTAPSKTYHSVPVMIQRESHPRSDSIVPNANATPNAPPPVKETQHTTSVQITKTVPLTPSMQAYPLQALME